MDAPWCIVGGWAIDLWLEEHTRPHEDIEISVLREDLGQFCGVAQFDYQA
jgi:Aminoglycoside-2''-adenylyltransferase